MSQLGLKLALDGRPLEQEVPGLFACGRDTSIGIVFGRFGGANPRASMDLRNFPGRRGKRLIDLNRNSPEAGSQQLEE
jgi:hypothetical protein